MGIPESFDSQAAKAAGGLNRRKFIIALGSACGLGVAAGAIATFGLQREQPDAVRLMQVAASERDQAEEAMGAKREHKQKTCPEPLAFVTVALASPNTTSSFFQIRSGTYLSPRFELSSSKRVAIPFPSPYREGRGTISIIGSGKNLAISLYPTWYVERLDGELIKPVFWTAHTECE
jgi:hypothetical protein